ncbi:hypothetical protein FHU36_003781 [Nonomuraea muscovyensis]|uniref:Uncharacterized protein n=1 Tax=Nonomuraea muscovyensis TaxID=1124761 RepID=A0A7X0C402_9ACTN|nr:hypothetical protein [Nonomuraea muscovyensis]MBB6347236.1 hypothetical protein [Nonomuraea muscovyensis]
MIGSKVWLVRRIRCLAPGLVRRQRPRDCCWHHKVNWRQAAAIAVHLVRQAHAAGIAGEDIGDFVMERVHDEHGDLDDRERTAIVLLVGLDAGIQLSEPGSAWLYGDGQHRVAAQLDQGVRETIVQRLELLDPVTGLPVT